MKTSIPVLLASVFAALATTEGATLGLSVKPERELLLKGGARDMIVQIELKAPDNKEKRKTPLNLSLVLDRSGSMEGAKLEKARQAASVAVDQLSSEDIFSLVIYDDETSVLIPPRKVEDKAALKREIATIQAGGSTALYAGVEKGAAQLRKYLDAEKVNRVILLSDGLANVGPSSPGDLSKLGRELRREGMSVSTIGVGDDYNEDLMTALAESGNANYYYVKDAEKLPDIFVEELGTVKSVAARDVTVRITLPDGVKPIGVLGEDDLVFKGQSIVIPLSEFSSSQTRRLLIACEAPAVDSEEVELARVEVSYDPLDGRPLHEQKIVKVRQSEKADEVKASTQSDVAVQAAVTRNRLAKEKAVRLADAGKSKEAADVLLRQAEANAALPTISQSPLLRQEDAELKRKASELQSSGHLSKSSRKSIQYQNYMDKNQKR